MHRLVSLAGRRLVPIAMLVAACSDPAPRDGGVDLVCGAGTVEVDRQCVIGATAERPASPPPIDGGTADATVPSPEPNADCHARVSATFRVPEPFAYAGAIAMGSDGNAWFLDPVSARIGRVSPAGTFTAFALPPSSEARALTLGSDGKLWVITGAATLARIASDGTATTIPGGSDQEYAITSGPDGNVWVAGRASVHRVSPSGAVDSFALGGPSGLRSTAIAAGPSAVWIARQGGAYSNVTHVTRVSLDGDAETFPTGIVETPGYALRAGIVADTSGGAWVSLLPGLARVSTTGTLTEIDLPAGGTPAAIARGAGGAIHFADFARRVGTIRPDGSIEQVPILYEPSALTTAVDGRVWLTAHEGTSSFVMAFCP